MTVFSVVAAVKPNSSPGTEENAIWPLSRNNAQNQGLSTDFSGPFGNQLIWSVQTDNLNIDDGDDDGILSSGVLGNAIIDSDGIVYFSANDGNVYSVFPSGSIQWKHALNDPNDDMPLPSTTSLVLHSDGFVAVMTEYNHVFALDKTDGTEWWEYYNDDYPLVSTPTIGPDDNIYIGSTNGTIVVIDSDGNGELIRTQGEFALDYQGNLTLFSPPAFDEDGNIFIVMTDIEYDESYLVFYYDDDDYNVIKFGTTIYSNPVVVGSNTCVGYDQYLYCYDINSDEVFRALLPDGANVIASMGVDSDETMYLPSIDGSLFAIDNEGSLLWTFTSSAQFHSSPSIDNNSSLYISGNDGYLYKINTQTGSLLWRFQTHNTGFFDFDSFSGSVSSRIASSVSIGDGVVYVGSSNGMMYCVGGSVVTNPDDGGGSGKKVESLGSSIIAVIVIFGLMGSMCLLVFVMYLCGFGDRDDEEDNDDGEKRLNDNNSNLQPQQDHSHEAGLFSSHFNWLWLGNRTNQKSLLQGTSTAQPPQPQQQQQQQQSEQKLVNDSSIGSLNLQNKMMVKDDLKIQWSDLELMNAANTTSAVIGKGAFGVVVRAVWTNPTTKEKVDVAVKVVMRSIATGSEQVDFNLICRRACEEVNIVNEATRTLPNHGLSIIKVFGVAAGSLPDVFTQLFHLQAKEEAIGIVMRYEAGGSLETLIHNRQLDKQISLKEKIRILAATAQGIADIHSINLVHADIKPDNVLLSTPRKPDVRLADFGLAMRQMESNNANNSMGGSSLAQTSHLRGTPIYCAPEMLTNPFAEEVSDTVARASRKTDMYAFGLLVWEVLAEQKPFPGIKTEATLCAKIHQGTRPSLDLLPKETPKAIIEMMTACWDKNRMQRKSATECLSILKSEYCILAQVLFDVGFFGAPGNEELMGDVYKYLSDRGLSVKFTVNTLDVSNNVTISKNMNVTSGSVDVTNRSMKMVVFVTQSLQENATLMNELTELRRQFPLQTLIVVALEKDVNTWMNRELRELIDMKKENDLERMIDLSVLAALNKRNRDENKDDDDDDDGGGEKQNGGSKNTELGGLNTSRLTTMKTNFDPILNSIRNVEN